MSNPVPSTTAYSPSYLPPSSPSYPPTSSLLTNEVARNAFSSAAPENAPSLQGRTCPVVVFRHPHMQTDSNKISADCKKILAKYRAEETARWTELPTVDKQSTSSAKPCSEEVPRRYVPRPSPQFIVPTFSKEDIAFCRGPIRETMPVAHLLGPSELFICSPEKSKLSLTEENILQFDRRQS